MPLTERQHEIRSRGLGSSDAAAAVGLSPWKSRVQLWLEKTGRVQREDISDKEIVHFGNVLEDVVAQEFSRRRGLKVQRRREPYTLEHESGLVMVANVDRLIVGTGGILEAKTADKWSRQKWDDVPEHYHIQVIHQLVTANKREAVLAVLIGGNEYQDFEIERHDQLSEFLVAKEAEFWRHVIDDVAPEPVSAADVVALYPLDSGKTKIATPELAEIHAELVEVRKLCKTFDEQKHRLEETIKLFIGEDAELLLNEGGAKLATWKTAKGSDYTHWDKIAADLEPLVDPEQYAQIFAEHSGTYPYGSRRFLVKPGEKT